MDESNVRNIIYDNWRINATSISMFDNGSPNDVWKVDQGDHSYVFKLCKLEVDIDWFDFQVDILNLWDKNGIPISLPIKTRFGTNYVIYNGHVFQLLEYARGYRYELNNVDMLTQVAELVTQLHESTYSRDTKKGNICKKSSFNDLEKWLLDPEKNILELRRTIQFHSKKINFDSEKYLFLIEEALYYLQRNFSFETYKKLPSVFTHGELHHTNIIFNNNKIRKLIDYDSIQFRPRIYDIARASLFLSRKKRGDFYVNTHYVSSFLKIYNTKFKLLPEEYDAINYVLLYYFIPTAHYINHMEKSNQLDWYLPWTMKGINYIKNHHLKLIRELKEKLL